MPKKTYPDSSHGFCLNTLRNFKLKRVRRDIVYFTENGMLNVYKTIVVLQYYFSTVGNFLFSGCSLYIAFLSIF